jgi:hypothetical protein
VADVFIGEEENLVAAALARVFGEFLGKCRVIRTNNVSDVIKERQRSGFRIVSLEKDKPGARLRSFLEWGGGELELDAWRDCQLPRKCGGEARNYDRVEPRHDLKEKPSEAAALAETRA